MSERGDKLASAIQMGLAGIITKDVKDPRVHNAGLLTVTRVAMSDDLRVARVFVSFVGGDEESHAAAVKGLSRAAGFLRGEIGRRLTLRRAPELRFVQDKTAEHVAKIEALLREDENK
jgi:ribosome-binding factor A